MNLPAKLLPWLATMFSALILVAVSLNWYKDYSEKSWLVYKDEPFKVLSRPPYKPGQTILFTVVRCNIDTIPHIYKIAHVWERTDGMTVLQPSADVTALVGCTTNASPFNVLPKEIAPGIPFPPGMWRASGISLIFGIRKTHEIAWQTEWIKVEAN